jgi:hypothetical protein
MPRIAGQRTGKCKTCASPHRAEVERLLARRATVLSVSNKFGLKPSGVYRHWQMHVSPATKAELVAGVEIDKLAETVAAESDSVLRHYSLVRAKLYAYLDGAAEAGDRNSMDRFAGRLHQNFREMAAITGELQKSPLLVQNNNVLSVNSPGAARLISTIVSAVAPFRDAAAAVAQALRKLEAEEQPVKLIEVRHASD